MQRNVCAETRRRKKKLLPMKKKLTLDDKWFCWQGRISTLPKKGFLE
jgi:hypothetical protein